MRRMLSIAQAHLTLRLARIRLGDICVQNARVRTQRMEDMKDTKPKRSIAERVRSLDIAQRMTWVVTVIVIGCLSKTEVFPKWAVILFLILAVVLQGLLMWGTHRVVKDINVMESSNNTPDGICQPMAGSPEP